MDKETKLALEMGLLEEAAEELAGFVLGIKALNMTLNGKDDAASCRAIRVFLDEIEARTDYVRNTLGNIENLEGLSQ